MQTVNYSDYIYYAGTTQPVVRVPVYVYEANTENLASLYDGSGDAIDNPTQTDDNGLFDFWTTFGKYDIYVHNTKEYSVSLLNLAYFYLGIYDANPTERPDGSELQDGDMYFNSVINHTKLYNNGLWYYADDMMNASGVAYDPASGPQTDVQTQMRAYDTHLDTIDTSLQSFVSTEIAIDDDTTVSDLGYTSLIVVDGGSFTIASGKTLTIDVPFQAGLYQVFDGDGSVVFGAGSVIEVYPEWWGAVGDGITNDTNAINAMFNAYPSGGVLVFSKTYKYSPLVKASLIKSCTIKMLQGSYLNVISATSGIDIIEITGSIGTPYLLGASPVKGDITITVDAALAATLSSGDIIRLTTDNAFGGSGELWNNKRDYYFKGELCEVLSVTGSVITLKTELLDGYTAANTVAMKVNTINVSLDNVSMKGTIEGLQLGLNVKYGRDIVITGGEITGTSVTALQLQYCYGGSIRGFAASNLGGTNTNQNYGIALFSSQNISITGCNIVGGRHSVALGGNEPIRNIVVSNNYLGSELPAAGGIDAHGNAQYFRYSNNTISGKGIIGGIDFDISDNTFIDTDRTTGASIVYDTGDLGTNIICNYARITNNLFSTTSDSTNNYCIHIVGRIVSSITNLVISGNTCRAIYIQQLTSGTLTVTNAIVSNNTILSPTSGIIVASYNTANKATITNLHISNNSIYCLAAPLSITDISGDVLTVNNNTVRTNNISARGGFPEMVTTDINRVYLTDNTIDNEKSAYYTTVVLATTAIIKGNIYQNYSRFGGLSATATTIRLINNSFISCTGTQVLTGTVYSISDGTGTPEAVITAGVGSLYTDRSGGAGTTLYVKQSGTGNTGWTAK